MRTRVVALDPLQTRNCTSRFRELFYGYRTKLDPEGQPFPLGRPLRRRSEAAALVARLLAHEPVEVFGILGLAAQAQILDWHVVSRGALDRTFAHPREVFLPAFLMGAASVICAHNHPSGDPSPSAEDLAVTYRLIDAGRLLRLPIVDHIIVGRDSVVSLRPLFRYAPSRRRPDRAAAASPMPGGRLHRDIMRSDADLEPASPA